MDGSLREQGVNLILLCNVPHASPRSYEEEKDVQLSFER